MTADGILDALIAASDDKIWASELALLSGGRRVDFWTLEPSKSRGYRAQSYEIKISRADYRRDSAEKQDGALRWCDRFWYVTPQGLLKREELPDWAGLQEWDGTRFSIVRKAPMRGKAEPDWEFVVSLLRNAGETRRDVGVMKAQLAFFQAASERDRERKRVQDRMTMQRWIQKSADQSRL